MQSIIEAFYIHAHEQPERPVLFFKDQTFSYGTLFAGVEGFARALHRWGLQDGQRVALLLENSPAFLVAYLGTLLAGGIVVLVNTQYRQVELSHIFNDSGARLCVTSAEGCATLLPLVMPLLNTLVLVDEVNPLPAASHLEITTYAAFCAGSDEQGSLSMPQAEMPAVLGYTSGTTGKAKGALLSHRNLLANIQAVTTAWHWTADDCLLLVLPLFHTHGLMVGLHGTLWSGGSAVLQTKFEASEILATLKTNTVISLFFGVPTMYIRLLAAAREQGVPERSLRLFVSGSAPLSSHVFAEFNEVFGQAILERYGMTETIMNLTNPYEGERRPGTVGGPFPGQEARVVERQTRQLQASGEIGEIEVRGPHVCAGYWNRPDATAEAFSADGWFKTGDLGWRSADGYYTITGRAHELIISGGYNIYPREIEDVLARHPAIGEVAVVGRPDPEMGEQVVAVVVLKPDQTASEAEIIAYCREYLASYKKPRRVAFVDLLPRNALGKVQKHLLHI